MEESVKKLASANLFEFSELEAREAALSYLVNPTMCNARLAFLSVFGKASPNASSDFSSELHTLGNTDTVDAIIHGKLSIDRIRKLCANPTALQAAFEACEGYLTSFELSKTSDGLSELLAQWTPDGSWLRKAKHSANVIRDYVKELRDLVDGVFACQFRRDVLAMSGDGGSPNSNADESQSSNEETFEPRVRNGLVEMRCRKADAPFGFGLLTLFDATEEATLLVCQPVLLSASPISYNLEVPLSDLFGVVPEHGDPEFVAASVATRHLFTKPMLEALMKLTANVEQRALIKDFIALIGD